MNVIECLQKGIEKPAPQDKELMITKIKHKQTLSFFGECIIVFQASAQFPKIKDISNTDLY